MFDLSLTAEILQLRSWNRSDLVYLSWSLRTRRVKIARSYVDPGFSCDTFADLRGGDRV
jgi:hypothetical protein